MVDRHTAEQRSYNMSRIKSTNTKPELLVRKFLFAHGFRYRLNVAKLPGKPDIVLKKYKAVIFVNGCFWHGHEGCRYYVIPETKTEWWLDKINGTKKRDKQAYDSLIEKGWRVFIVWECELKSANRLDTLDRLRRNLIV